MIIKQKAAMTIETMNLTFVSRQADKLQESMLMNLTFSLRQADKLRRSIAGAPHPSSIQLASWRTWRIPALYSIANFSTTA